MADSKASRLAYIDWMRGLACVLMFQTHCYDSWLSPAARRSSFFTWSQVLGTLPAPLFLFLSGLSVSLVIGKLESAGAAPNKVAATVMRRGAQILGLGLLFRLQEYLIAFPWAPWTDLFRVDILNTIGVSIALLGGLYWIVGTWYARYHRDQSPVWALGTTAALTAAVISCITPMLWTVWRPRLLPWPLESYLDGVHNLGIPQSWMFPVFPWTGFAFVGLACGVFLSKACWRKREAILFSALALAGVMMVVAGKWLNSRPQLYRVVDFWRTSPNFFLIRVGILFLILAAAYAWCRWAWRGFSPLIQLGQTSLLVYWVHIELVYGRISILKKHAMSVPGASVGLLIICLAMLILSVARTRFKRSPFPFSWFPVRARSQQAGQ